MMRSSTELWVGTYTVSSSLLRWRWNVQLVQMNLQPVSPTAQSGQQVQYSEREERPLLTGGITTGGGVQCSPGGAVLLKKNCPILTFILKCTAATCCVFSYLVQSFVNRAGVVCYETLLPSLCMSHLIMFCYMNYISYVYCFVANNWMCISRFLC